MTSVSLSVSVKSQSPSGNYTDVNWSIRLTPSRSVNASMTASAVINGTTVVNYAGNPGYIEFNTTRVIASGTHRVTHNADGTKSFTSSVTARTNTQGMSWSFNVSNSGSHTMPRIPRTSKPSLSSSAVTMGEKVTINFNKASSSFQHSAIWTFGSQSGTITGKTSASSFEWTTPIALLAPVIPNSISGSGEIVVTTWDGNTSLGTEKVAINHNVPKSVAPSPGTLTISDSEGYTTSVGGYVQNKSKASVSLTGSTGIYGSTIKSTVIKVGSSSVNSSSAIIPLTTSGSVSVSATVTDSRGRTATTSLSPITVNAYSPPIINVTAKRSNVSNAIQPLGTYIRFDGTTSVHDLKVGTWRNSRTVNITRNVVGQTTKTSLYALSSSSIISGTIPSPLGSGAISAINAYVVTITVTDKLGTSTVRSITVPSGQVALSVGKTGIGAGKIWSKGALDVGGDAYVDGSLNVSGGMNITDVSEMESLNVGGTFNSNNINYKGQTFGDTHQIFTDGKWWLASGSILCPSFSWAISAHPIYSATVDVTVPFTPPPYYTFLWSVQVSSGYTFVANAGTRMPDVNNKMAIRITQFNNASTTALSRLQWLLVRV